MEAGEDSRVREALSLVARCEASFQAHLLAAAHRPSTVRLLVAEGGANVNAVLDGGQLVAQGVVRAADALARERVLDGG